jgi:hypothetical protein
MEFSFSPEQYSSYPLFASSIFVKCTQMRHDTTLRPHIIGACHPLQTNAQGEMKPTKREAKI